MSYIKSKKDITYLVESGKRIGEIMQELYDMIRPGLTTLEIDRVAEERIRATGGRPAFKGYQPRGAASAFPGTICACLNDEVVHGIPSDEREICEGDIFTVDMGMVWTAKKGVYTDTAFTKAVGSVPQRTQLLLDVTRDALESGLNACMAGNTVADIGRAVEDTVRNRGNYGIIRDLCGHGVGHEVHEEPYVLNYYQKSLEAWELRPGVVLAIEPMITLGSEQVKTDDDDWTIRTTDGSLSAHFEHTVVITEDEPIVVTRRPGEIHLNA